MITIGLSAPATGSFRVAGDASPATSAPAGGARESDPRLLPPEAVPTFSRSVTGGAAYVTVHFDRPMRAPVGVPPWVFDAAGTPNALVFVGDTADSRVWLCQTDGNQSLNSKVDIPAGDSSWKDLHGRPVRAGRYTVVL